MAIKTHILPSDGIQSQYRVFVLEVIASRKRISIEELLDALPWMRWGELFSILGSFSKEGVVVLDRRGLDFDVRMNESRLSFGSGLELSSFCLKRKHISGQTRQSKRYLTRS